MKRNRKVLGIGLVLAVILPFVYRCDINKINRDDYVVTGRVSGLKSDSVYLYNTLTNEIRPTAVYKEKFTFKGKVDYPEMFEIYFNKEETKFTRLFLENSKISIKGDLDSLEKVQIIGSASNDEYNRYSKSIGDLRQKYMHLTALYDDALDRHEYSKSDSLEVLVSQSAHLILDAVYDYASVNKSSSIIPYIMHMASLSAPDRTLTSKITNLLDNNGRSNPRILKLNSMLDDIERTSVGSKAADFEMSTSQGNVIRLSDYYGKVVLLDFWASWCAPCIKEFPELKAIYEEFRGDEFEIIGFSIDKNLMAWENALTNHKLPWPQVVELQGPEGPAPKKYGIVFIPTVFLIDKKGTIAGINLHGERLAKKIEELIKN